MGRKNRNQARASATPAVELRPAPVAPAGQSAQRGPAEFGGSDPTVLMLASMMFVAPGIGSPWEELLQDTLKSAVVALVTLVAALLAFWNMRASARPLRWHGILWLPLALCAYALGSMAWAHTYLGGVEAVRWFLFALIAWLSLNALSAGRLALLSTGVHAGAVMASVWVVMQFWGNFGFFPQGPNPASTFVNRNFFAEFAVATLPFGWYLLARVRQSGPAAMLSASIGFICLAIMMTGTRSALGALAVQLLVVLPLAAWRCRGLLPWSSWKPATRILAVAGFAIIVLGAGSLPSANPNILQEERGTTALERATMRARSIQLQDDALGVRMKMWAATLRMIRDRPLSGVGAGAWESYTPLYQERGAQLETDYYVHNEYLQLVAEYGLVGWAVLCALVAWLAGLAWRTVRPRDPGELAEVPVRVVLLTCLLALSIVSVVGFPWRMAATGTLMALSIGGLAASQWRTGAPRLMRHTIPWSPAINRWAAFAAAACLVLAVYIVDRAARAEFAIVRATRLALSVSASGQADHPQWAGTRAEVVALIREGVALNGHYRKITPMVADELARWGDWGNAVWVWESVAASRPYVAAILGNIARAHAVLGDAPRSILFLERAKAIQPDSPGVRAVELVVLSRTGREDLALAKARELVAQPVIDAEILTVAFNLGWRNRDTQLALRSMELRTEHFPATRQEGFLLLARFFHDVLQDEDRVVESYIRAIASTRREDRRSLFDQIPEPYRTRVQAQMSASSK